MLVDVRVCGVEWDHAVALIDDAEYGNNCGCGPHAVSFSLSLQTLSAVSFRKYHKGGQNAT